MDAPDAGARSHQWIDAGAVGAASNVALGGVALLVGLVTIWGSRATWNRDGWGLPDSGFFPTVLGALLVAVALILLVRGWLGRAPRVRWRLRDLAIVVACIAAVDGIAWRWGGDLALRFGPPEFAALLALELTVAIALARVSRARATAMVLLGLLLAMVGLDVITGELRLTMGLEVLMEGVDVLVVSLGLLAVADGVICLYSPSLFVATYARLVAGWSRPAIPSLMALGMRIVAALVLAAACFVAFNLNARAWDVGVMLVFGALGIACKILVWNRLVLLLAAQVGVLLEQNIRHTLILSNGGLAIFLQRPISGALLLLTVAVLAASALLSGWRAFESVTPR
jgi:TctA family transporter